MASISDAPYEQHGGDDSGRDSLDFTAEHHHVSAVDTPKGGDPAGAKEAATEVKETDSHESRLAQQGARWALDKPLLGDPMPFKPSVGVFTTGPDVGQYFDRAVRDSGGVHQGPGWCSDPAPGIHRSTEEHTITLDTLHKQDKGSGNTFETQRRSNWSHDRWGG